MTFDSTVLVAILGGIGWLALRLERVSIAIVKMESETLRLGERIARLDAEGCSRRREHRTRLTDGAVRIEPYNDKDL